jgi:aspartokinase/homoserine dehydrogenase 1
MSRSAPPSVHKFGGAALADAAAMRHAVAIIKGLKGPAVFVVSAMAGVTDLLLGAAQAASRGDDGTGRQVATLRAQHVAACRALLEAGSRRQQVEAAIDDSLDELTRLLEGLRIVGELTPRLSDHIAARGELLSALLVSEALAAARRKVVLLDPAALIVTDGRFGQAAPDLAATDRQVRRTVRPLLARGIAPVVPGFIGGGPAGAMVTLGRGGSDLTATLMARALGAREVSLWKDVPGFLTADPRVVPDARVLPHLHTREAAELAYYGAKVLHPRALIPLQGRPVAVRVRPFATPAIAGTEVSERKVSARSPVRAVSSITGQALATVAGNGMLGVPGIAARTFESLHRRGLSVSLITQASSEHSISFTVPEVAAADVRRALEDEFSTEIARGEIDGVDVRTGMATVAVVGLGMAGARGVAARVFGAVAQGGINIVAIAQGSSELNISFVVEQAARQDAERRIHHAFQLDKIGGGQVTAPERVAVVLFGFGQVGRTLARMLARAKRPGLQLEIAAAIDRSGFVFSPDGLSPARIAELTRLKRQGRKLVSARGGRPGGPMEALRFVAEHALPRPVVVDVTASDTATVLRHVLQSGMDVVLANKRPMTERRADAEALREAALASGRHLLFEATVGAGLPVIDTAKKLVESGDRIRRIEGCLSGTLGFLLTEVSAGRGFAEALREAMERGYTEPDPREDLSGMDVARKALILGQLIGFRGGIDDVQVESLVPASSRSVALAAFLARLDALDAAWQARVEAARATGGALRYVARVTPRAIQVGLTVVPAESALGSLRGTDNQVVFTTDRYRDHPLVITGPGAGLEVTAAGLMNDVMQLA